MQIHPNFSLAQKMGVLGLVLPRTGEGLSESSLKRGGGVVVSKVTWRDNVLFF